ncbi:MAG: PEP-CTERM sorting domain-containing protein [Candidatus Thiodiazotropha sp.]
MKFIKITSKIILLLWVSTNIATANPIYYELTDYGGGSYEYQYTVDNQTLSSIEEFTIWFDLGLYDNLAISGSPNLDWDGLAIQPDPLLPDDGFADWLSYGLTINPGEVLDGFSVTFDWLGSGTPGEQSFEIINPLDFSALSSGFTQTASTAPPTSVPEPDTWVLMVIGLLFLGIGRLRKTSNRLFL